MASDIASVSRDVLRLAREVDLNERRKVRSADSSSSITSVSERTQRERDSNSCFTSGNPVAKTQQAQIFKPGASRPAPIKVPVISLELTKIGENLTAFTTIKAPSDISIGQMVSDRSIAYVLSGGLGCDKHSA